MFFQEIPEAPADPIFGLSEAFKKETNPEKVNLVVGIYRDDDLQPYLMSSVKKAKEKCFEEDLLADYLPIDGLPSFCDKIGELAFGEETWKLHQGRIYAAQTIGGTGALQLGGRFLLDHVSQKFFLSNPTWPNHTNIFQRLGFQMGTYAYYDRRLHGIDFHQLCVDLKQLSENSVVLLHTVCHNPTGVDLTKSEWKEISSIIKRRRLVPFFDFAYQGFGENLKEDRKAIDLFLADGHEMAIAYSCSKNFSLYCQRVGALFIVAPDEHAKLKIGSQIKRIIRSIYSNPPAHGARIVSMILNTPRLKQEWEEELQKMQKRFSATRSLLIDQFADRAPDLDFSFLKGHQGMFSFMDLDEQEVLLLRKEFGIYMTGNGRISLAGLNKENLNYVVDSIIKVCK
jgi:aspartate/tyrosine/aromatic aminotransferase